MAALCASLTVMCVILAVAWRRERERADCWAAAAELDLAPNGVCAAEGRRPTLESPHGR